MTNRQLIIKEEYQQAIKAVLTDYLNPKDADEKAHQLTEKLLALRQANGKRKPKKGKTRFMVMSEIFIDRLGMDTAKTLFLSLAGNDQIKCKSVYIPSVKRIEQLLGQ